MNKADLVTAVLNTGNHTSRAAAQQAVEDVLNCISEGIANDGKVQLVGFGTFGVKERAARTGRNPRTGESIAIAASKSVNFKPGKGLKDSL
jgi:DNA-binding protein HU-beta